MAREMYEFLEEHEEYDAVAAYQEQRKEGHVSDHMKCRNETQVHQVGHFGAC